MGVLAASIGAAAFGAVQYMFLGGALPADIIPGVENGVLIPIVLGAIGLILGFGWAKGTVKDILVAGSAASVGFGIATFAKWIQPGPGATVGARARYAAPAPIRAVAPAPVPMMTATGVNMQTKMI